MQSLIPNRRTNNLGDVPLESLRDLQALFRAGLVVCSEVAKFLLFWLKVTPSQRELLHVGCRESPQHPRSARSPSTLARAHLAQGFGRTLSKHGYRRSRHRRVQGSKSQTLAVLRFSQNSCLLGAWTAASSRLLASS